MARKQAMLKQTKFASIEDLEAAFHQQSGGTYLRDIILGANDGIVTTFAVVSGVAGAALAPSIIVILGIANLVADGISMGAGVFLGEHSEQNYNKLQRQKENWEVDNFRPIEIQEVRDVLEKWGFAGQDLDRATDIIIRDRKTWIDFMMREELGIMDEGQSGTPVSHGTATFIAFVIAGAVPLLSYLVPFPEASRFTLSIAFSFATLFAIGAARSKFSPVRWYISGFEMLIVGVLAGGAAYLVGLIVGKFA